ncbi:MAG: hypothetical protein IKT47_00430 [Oscillospiraceae bacterium]|nr:hypothetical protein [Oscillospiraceae bacterium]
MIELTIRVDSINYTDLSELLLPMLSDRLPKDGLMGRLLNSPERAESLVKEILGRMSQEQKDELLVKYINQNSDKAMDKLEDMAARNGVSMKLGKISAKTL